MKIKLISKSPEETIKVAESIAKSLPVNGVISLVGDLGAGKTTFTKGFAKALGIKDDITSPTFTLMNEYSFDKGTLYHFDFYRLANSEEAFSLGFEDYFDLKLLKGYTIVEWAENAIELLPARHTVIEINKINDNEREILIEYKGIIL